MVAPKWEFTHGSFDEAVAGEYLADDGFKTALITGFRLLGTAFVASPKTEDFMHAIGALRSIELPVDWPFGDEGQLSAAAELFAKGCAEEDQAELVRVYTRLFRGPHALPAPPWASVYMDRDQVMYGWTWNELLAWMRANGVTATYEENDPEDHIGRLLLMAANIAEERPELLCELLADHILCFSDHFLGQFVERAESPTYTALGILTRTTLADVQSCLAITPAQRRFYR